MVLEPYGNAFQNLNGFVSAIEQVSLCSMCESAGSPLPAGHRSGLPAGGERGVGESP